MWPPTAHSAWYSAPVDTGVLAAGNYALMAFSGATTNGRVVNYDSVSSYTYFLSSVATTAPDPFGGAAGTTSLRYSIYATYEESGGGGTTVTTTKGSLSLTASPISIDVSLVLDTGAINLTGDNLGTKVNVTLDIGSLLTSGKEISQDVSAILSSGSVTFTGQDLTFATVIALNLDTGELTFVGDNVAFDVTIHLDKGDFAVSGKQVLINGEVVARKISKMFGFELNLWS
jgi:hypothetical protein